MSNITINQTPPSAFYAQATTRSVSRWRCSFGTAHLPVSSWMRAFLALGLLYAVTSAFTLAKCVRDSHEANSVVHRVDKPGSKRFLT